MSEPSPQPDIILYLDERLDASDREELADLIRNLVCNEYWGEFSNTVIGPSPLES